MGQVLQSGVGHEKLHGWATARIPRSGVCMMCVVQFPRHKHAYTCTPVCTSTFLSPDLISRNPSRALALRGKKLRRRGQDGSEKICCYYGGVSAEHVCVLSVLTSKPIPVLIFYLFSMRRESLGDSRAVMPHLSLCLRS